MPAEQIRVVIVEDHEMYRRGLCAQFETDPGIEVVGQFGTAAEAVRSVPELRPTVTLMDLQLPWHPGEDVTYCGADAIRRIRQAWPAATFAVITMHSDHEHVRRALLAGATAYILKDGPADEVISKVRLAAEGKGFMDPKIAAMLPSLVREASGHSLFPHLTPRKNQILRLLADGHDNVRIAKELEISRKTVENRLSEVLGKLQVTNRREAVELARATRRNQDARVPEETG